jgi:FkbM family methyltransferase
MLELSNENLSTAKASNSLTTKAKSLVACGRLKPNSVKIDVEGAEIEVLRGMSHTIRQFKPTILLSAIAYHSIAE